MWENSTVRSRFVETALPDDRCRREQLGKLVEKLVVGPISGSVGLFHSFSLRLPPIPFSVCSSQGKSWRKSVCVTTAALTDLSAPCDFHEMRDRRATRSELTTEKCIFCQFVTHRIYRPRTPLKVNRASSGATNPLHIRRNAHMTPHMPQTHTLRHTLALDASAAADNYMVNLPMRTPRLERAVHKLIKFDLK